MNVHINWVTITFENIFYHCMSRLLYINMCIFRCFIHSHCHHWMLSNIWFNKCVMVLHGRLSKRIHRLCRTHKGMEYQVEPIYVVRWTLARRYTYLTNRCNVFGKLNPSIINVFYTERRSSRGGGMVCTYPNYHTTLFGRCMTIDGTHLICLENKEISSNSLNARWSPYGIQHTTSDVNLSNRLWYIDTSNAFLDFQR